MSKFEFKGGPKDGETHEIPPEQLEVEVTDGDTVIGIYTRKNDMNWTSRWQFFWRPNGRQVQ